jgi:hypothetical protein
MQRSGLVSMAAGFMIEDLRGRQIGLAVLGKATRARSWDQLGGFDRSQRRFQVKFTLVMSK